MTHTIECWEIIELGASGVVVATSPTKDGAQRMADRRNSGKLAATLVESFSGRRFAIRPRWA